LATDVTRAIKRKKEKEKEKRRRLPEAAHYERMTGLCQLMADLDEIREVSTAVAVAVIKQALEEDLGSLLHLIDTAVTMKLSSAGAVTTYTTKEIEHYICTQGITSAVPARASVTVADELQEQLAARTDDELLEGVKKRMWSPRYHPLIYSNPGNTYRADDIFDPHQVLRLPLHF